MDRVVLREVLVAHQVGEKEAVGHHQGAAGVAVPALGPVDLQQGGGEQVVVRDLAAHAADLDPVADRKGPAAGAQQEAAEAHQQLLGRDHDGDGDGGEGEHEVLKLAQPDDQDRKRQDQVQRRAGVEQALALLLVQDVVAVADPAGQQAARHQHQQHRPRRQGQAHHGGIAPYILEGHVPHFPWSLFGRQSIQGSVRLSKPLAI